MKFFLTLLFLLSLVSLALAHPPAGAKKTPSKADPLLKRAKDAQKKGDTKAYDALILEAKKILASEGKYACCIKGGCDECAIEGNCGCGANLFEKKGVCKTCLEQIKAGNGRYDVNDGITPDMLFEEPEMGNMGTMRGTLGPWTMNREGSGTAWLPDSSPMYGRMLERGAWQVMEMGMAIGAYGNSGGKRGESQVFGATQYMQMAQKTDDKGRTVGLRGMFSLDPLTNGKRGYPNLFQTGETANGKPLKDRQHPHDLVMELAAVYSTPLGGDKRGFLYLAPAGEPAIGPAAFQHRPSAWDNPSAPISHHWLDGTHITYGVATVGMTVGDTWKVEGSAFNGREPNENRYDIDKIRFNSYTGRITNNPNKNVSIQASYAAIKSPELLEPSVDMHRFTASMIHNKTFENGDNLASMVALGQNIPTGNKTKTTALLLETAYVRNNQTYFARLDNTQKDELVNVPTGNYRIQKFTVGGIHKNTGVSLDFYAYPSALKPYYGNSPVSLNIFYRRRFGKMEE
jgi:hypothetical protein